MTWHSLVLAVKDDPDQTMTKGVTGTVATLGSAYISLMEIEGYLRVASLCIGCIVGLVTLYSIVTDMRRKKAKAELNKSRFAHRPITPDKPK